MVSITIQLDWRKLVSQMLRTLVALAGMAILGSSLGVGTGAPASASESQSLAAINVTPNTGSRSPSITAVLDGSITGNVTLGVSGPPAALNEVRVTRFLTDQFGQNLDSVGQSVLTDATGGFSFAGITAHSVFLQFDYLGPAAFADSWTPSGSDRSERVAVVVNGAAVMYDMEIPAAGGIAGVATNSSGVPVAGVEVIASVTLAGPWFSTATDASGSYGFAQLLPDDYLVRFEKLNAFDNQYYDQFWGVTPVIESVAVEVSAGNTQEVSPVLIRMGSVLGNGLCPRCGTSSFLWSGQFYTLEVKDPATGEWKHTRTTYPPDTNTFAGFIFNQLFPGTYRFIGSYAAPYGWGIGMSAEVTVSEGQNATVSLSMVPPSTSRIGGANRFASAANMASAWRAPDNTGTSEVVYVSNGLNWPDALGSGPAAASEGAPLLLVTPTSVPAETAAQLRALMPGKIVILGGTASVSTSVELQLRRYAASIVRIAGPDRYSVSRSIARYAFITVPTASPEIDQIGSTVAYIATGAGFPDALIAGAAGAHVTAPLIMVNGALGSIDSQSLTLLRDLGVTEVVIVGSPGSVSAGIEASLRAQLGDGVNIIRYYASDRYQSSVVVNSQFGQDEASVYLVSGANYPDALAGAALAAHEGRLVYLVPPTCVPLATAQAIANRRPDLITLLGGPGSLSANVAALGLCP